MGQSAPSPSLLEEVAQRTKLREGPDGVANFIRIALQNEPLRLNEIARRMRLPIPVATALRRELEGEDILARGAGVELTEAGCDFARHVLGFSAVSAAICPECHGTGLATADPAMCRELAQLLEDAPPTRVDLDQAPCTVETALRRAALMHHQGALEGRRVIMLGDDDSISLACWVFLNAVRGEHAKPLDITVLEIDPERVRFLRRAAEQLKISLSVVEHDLRNPLPETLRDRFDTFQTDPPYTLAGSRLFVGRAIQSLRGTGGKGFLSFGHKAPSEQRNLLQDLIESGFSISRIHPDFNSYLGASILGGRSQLIELDAVATGAQDIRWQDGPLYTAQQTQRTRSYQCTGCGLIVNLGQDGAPATIEELKAKGCPSCKGTVFRRKSARKN